MLAGILLIIGTSFGTKGNGWVTPSGVLIVVGLAFLLLGLFFKLIDEIRIAINRKTEYVTDVNGVQNNELYHARWQNDRGSSLVLSILTTLLLMAAVIILIVADSIFFSRILGNARASEILVIIGGAFVLSSIFQLISDFIQCIRTDQDAKLSFANILSDLFLIAVGILLIVGAALMVGRVFPTWQYTLWIIAAALLGLLGLIKFIALILARCAASPFKRERRAISG